MAHHAQGAVRRRPFLAPLAGRSPDEPHRVSTPLELFFDLVIVVAVARAASGLHHAIVENHAGPGVVMYAMVFFGIWWAWVNFTWFASAYDNDDVVYRLLVLVQLTGALIFAAGIPNFEHGDLRVGVTGYVLMRLALVTLWLRAARADPARRRTTLRYAGGVTLVQVAWIGSLFLPPGFLRPAFWTLALVEILVPAWAERASRTPWHPEHIAERYGLFTLITLGESILAASLAVQAAAEHGSPARGLMPVLAGGLLIVFAFWWLYFEHPGHEVLTSVRSGFLWGYAHYFVLGAAAAVGAGLAAAVDQAADRAAISARAAGVAVAIPAAVFLACLWFLHARSDRSFAARVVTPGAVVAILLSPLTGHGVLATGLVMAALTAFKVRTAAVAARA
jgi:low temperature requirement protein LtrA